MEEADVPEFHMGADTETLQQAGLAPTGQEPPTLQTSVSAGKQPAGGRPTYKTMVESALATFEVSSSVCTVSMGAVCVYGVALLFQKVCFPTWHICG